MRIKILIFFIFSPLMLWAQAPPTDITLSNSVINENTGAGFIVGTLSTVDPDVGDVFTYSLANGLGDTDNSDFSIVGNELHIAISANFEAKSSYSIRIKTVDQTSNVFEKQFTILINDVNETPTDVTLGTSSIAENVSANSLIGTLNSNDQDASNTFTYSLVTGTGSTNNSEFTISGNSLLINASPDYEVKNSYSIRIRTADQGSLFYEKTFTITITNVNENPTDIGLSPGSITENMSAISSVGNLSTSDPDAVSTFTYSLVSGDGSTDNASFTISGNSVLINASPDYEAKNSYNIRISTTDQGGLFYEKAFTITIANVNETPTDFGLSPGSIAENISANSSVGTLNTSDPDAGNTFTYSLVSGTGSTDNGSFTISGNSLLIDASPDYEAKNSYNVRLRTTDQGGLFHEKVFTITITDVNENPTNIALSPGSIAENMLANSSVGTLNTSDPDAGNTFTYSLVSGTGSTDNALFTISGNSVLINTSLDYETKNNYNIRIRSTDQGGLYFEKEFTISITNVNETPTDIGLSPGSIAENMPANSSVGTLTTSDPDAGNTFTYTLVAGTGSTDNGAFTISGNNVLINASQNYEVKNSYSIRIRTTDQGGLFYEKEFAITITDVNEDPTNISLSTSFIAENMPANSSVGTLTTSDPDAGNTFTYTLVAGTGSTDNGSFIISGNSVLINASPDYEAKNSYSIRLRTTDQGGLFHEKVFAITITDVNEDPTNIALSTSSIAENMPVNSAIGTLSSTDPDAANTFTYSLVAGAGNTDNGAFTISGNSLLINASPDYEAKNSYSIRVRTTDQGGLYYEKALTISITNVNETPTNVALSSSSIAENVPANSPIGTLSSTDPDAGNTFTYSLVTGAGSTDNGSFTVSGNSLLINASPDYETKNSYSLRIRTTDQGGLFFEKAFIVAITNVNEAPTDINLTNNTINENMPAVTIIGTFSSVDVDAGSSFSYSFASGTGSDDNGSFSINGAGQLLSAASFNFEAKSSYSIRIRTTDNGVPILSYEKVFVITIGDVNEAPVITSSVSQSVPENTTGVFTVGFSDEDTGDTHIFSIVGGADASKFSINNSTGQLSFISAPDYEIPADANLDNNYAVTIRVTDNSGLYDTKTFLVTVTNVNEAPLARNLSITGQVTVCKTLTGNYDFFDYEGDNQGTSTFKWYWSDSPTGLKTVISGANAKTYTLTSVEQAKYIFFEVTPVASTGVLTGTAMISGPVGPVSNLLPSVTVTTSAAAICHGKNTSLNFSFTGTPPFNLIYTDGTNNFPVSTTGYSYSTTVSTAGNYKGVTLTDYLNCPVTNLPSHALLTVNPTPTVSITNLNTAYSITNNPVVMVGSPTGGVFSGDGVVPSTNTFYPSIAGTNNSPHSIIYSYTIPATGCTSSDTVKVTIIDADAVIVGIRDQLKYCNFDKAFNISGANSAGVIGNFTITGGTGLTDHNNNTATINPSALSPGNYVVTYTYLNVVPLSITKTITIESVAQAQILNLPAATYCSNIPDIKLSGNFNTGNVKKGVFSGNGILRTSDSIYYLKPSLGPTGSSYVKYTYATSYGCKTSDSVNIVLASSPKSAYTVSNSCWNGDSSIFVNLSTPEASIKNTYWNFGDVQATEIDNKSVLKNPKHKYLNLGSKRIQLISVTDLGCRDTLSNELYLGGIPMVNFTWNTECFNSGVPITFKNSITSHDPVVAYNWKIKGVGNNVINYSTADISQTFTMPGDYKVMLVSTTNAACKDSMEKQIRVRPTYDLKDTSYFIDFEGGRNYWFENTGTSNTWSYGLPAGTKINSAYSGTSVFSTKITGNYNQQLIVTSPCFSFPDSARNFIELFVNGDNPKDKEGAVLQYLLKDSAKWETIGGLSSGVNWYTSSSIVSSPGGQSYGWSGSTDGWVSTRHSLDMLSNRKDVQLRIVYGTNSTVSGRDGFAFDNIFIGKRNKSVLMEHFANNSSSVSNQSNDKLNELLTGKNLDLITLQYHTSFPGTDTLNTYNQSDPGARLLYYGIGSVPLAIAEGGTDAKYMYDFVNKSPSVTDVSVLSVGDADYSFNIKAELKQSTISGTVVLKALRKIPARQTTIYLAVVEDVTVLVGGTPVVYYNVVKKLLPTAAGTPLRNELLKDQTVSIGFNYNITKIYNPQRIKIIAFVQDESTREVYQVATSNSSVIVGVTDIKGSGNELAEIKLYPNPASDVVYLTFERELTEKSSLQVIDGFGRVMSIFPVLSHVNMVEIPVNQLSNGIYYLRLVQSNGKQKTLKLMVSH